MKQKDRGRIMKRTRWIKCTIFTVIWLTVIFTASTASARGFGYTQTLENFPKAMNTAPSCSRAYQDYLAAAEPHQACLALEEARTNLAVQEALKKELGAIKNCQKCRKDVVEANAAAATCREQISIYEGRCPGPAENAELAKKLPKLEKMVCRACHDKWPGTIGPGERTPCE